MVAVRTREERGWKIQECMIGSSGARRPIKPKGGKGKRVLQQSLTKAGDGMKGERKGARGLERWKGRGVGTNYGIGHCLKVPSGGRRKNRMPGREKHIYRKHKSDST